MRSALKRPRLLTRLAKLVVPRALRPSQFLGFQIQAHANQQIHSGPFRGMKYLEHSYWNLYYPKLFRLLPPVYVTGPMNEFRPKEMCWMIIKPRKKNEL
jgi:hypothetical protein